MNTDLVSRTGLMPEIPAQMSKNPVDELEVAVERVLAAVRPSSLTDPIESAHSAETALRTAVRAAADGVPDDAMSQALACAEAACEHLRYLEFQEARLLLVAARGQLVRSHGRRA
ncbi:hypothetical protein [Saccharothrix coeruleofusca]|uniref:Uncharacterized protein n=1 Tax=Saccharothrix coeruleofusca TaxID=33919 RepID=A0A918AU19_9PSEU|nr:hypothetical protein [Saccharothrix coeruleofusca]MBP2337709.1 hypothetical protein [Saccharothrix coeruleofusca]GGP84600.1 hypothetical protein GCM10010185_68080 [Saccharothrix coeruleofusca]